MADERLHTRLGRTVKEAIIDYCKVPRTRKEIARHIGLEQEALMARYVRGMVESGKLFRVYPEYPHTPSQRYVVDPNSEAIRTGGTVIEFCKTAKRISDIAKFLNLDAMTTRTLYVLPLIEQGRLQRTAAYNGTQLYQDAAVPLSEQQRMCTDKKAALKDKYGTNGFTVKMVVADFNLGKRYVEYLLSRMKKQGHLDYIGKPKFGMYVIKE